MEKEKQEPNVVGCEVCGVAMYEKLEGENFCDDCLRNAGAFVDF